MIKPQEYKKAQNDLKIVWNEETEQEKEFEKSLNEIDNKYYKLIRDLKDKQYQKEKIINKQKEKFKKQIKNQREPLREKVEEFKRIIDFIEVDKRKKDIDLNIEIYNYDYLRDEKGEVIRTKNGSYPEKEKVFLKPISVLRDNEFYKIAVYIYKNRKPVNKYALCVVGRSIFTINNLLDFRFSYLQDINENGHFKKCLKELPNKKGLILWFEKNKDKVFNNSINKIEETIKEYKDVIKNTNFNEWEIAYLENKKDYYENNYSNGTEEPEYFNIISELIKLTNGEEQQKYIQIIKNRMIKNLN